MRTIDIHAHLVPRSLWEAVAARRDWYGYRHEPGDGVGAMVGDGADRVVLGSDWPFVPWHPSPVAWVQGLRALTQDEKEKILWRNLEGLLKL